MSNLKLVEINEENFLQAFALRLEKGQEKFVSNPIRSLAQAYVYRDQCTPFGIYKEDVMVGYVMIIYDYDKEEYNIWHFMIDADYQGKGYGRESLKLCKEYIKKKPFGASNKIILCCEKENVNAMHLYRTFGFCETGNTCEDEIEFESMV